MSVENWAGLREDPGHRLTGKNEESEEIVEEPGRWQEELEFSVYADSSMAIPGKGSPGENCGEWFPGEFCDECGKEHYTKTHCGKRVCPDCYGLWTKERAVGITRRLSAGRYAEEGGIDRRAVHTVMSPPEGEITSLTEVYQGFREAYSLAREKGVRGGVAVFHGFRVQQEVQQKYRAVDPDMGIWRWVREERPEHWRELTYWSPHYHIIGLCREFEADDPDAQDGWVARRIRSLERYEGLTDTESYEDMVGAARYLLSHATFETDSQRDCVRWFGSLATTNFQPEAELSNEELASIEEHVEEVVGHSAEQGEGEPENEECEDCGSTSRSPIWDARAALQDPGWCERIGRDRQKRLKAAFEWAVGEAIPPPGLQKPRTEEEAREALETLL